MKYSMHYLVVLLAGSLFSLASFADYATAEEATDIRSKQTLDLEVFRRIPVLRDGRKMPMDTFARQQLLQFSGRKSIAGKSAVDWFARVLFAPESVRDMPVFLLDNPESAQALGFEADNRARYSIAELETDFERLEHIVRTAYEMEGDDYSPVEDSLIRLYLNLIEYIELTQAFSFAQVGDPFVVEHATLREQLHLPEDSTDFSFLEIHRHGAGLRPLMQQLTDTPQAAWTALDWEVARLSMALYDWAHHYEDLNFAMIPLVEAGEERWVSAWKAIAQHMQRPGVSAAVNDLHSLALAYDQGDQQAFDEASEAFIQFIHTQLPEDRELQWTNLEVALNKLNPFFCSKLLYTFAFLVAIASLLTRAEFREPGRLSLTLRWVAVGFCVAALIPHSTGIIMRILIMGRPPATNLYATFLFVAWVGAILGLLVESRQRMALGVLSAAICGLSLLLVANYFAYDGDTMGKVVAVLSSNFWLSVHVLTITMGYAGCVLAGLIGHVYLMTGCFAPRNNTLLDALKRALYGVLGFGLIFTFLGTMLGGVWADQSWGRFWGWDPKENGALLIVLWCAGLFHAKIARMIGDVGMAAGSALGIIIIMFAWLGVNLLGVGLHSYGFTSGLAWGLYLYIALQVVLLAFITPIARYRLKS